MLFSNQNVKYIFFNFYGNLPYKFYYFSCLFISFLSTKEHPPCYSLECFPTFCVLLLDTVDQSANEIHDFAGPIFRVGEIIACAPRKSKEKMKQQSEHSTAVLEHELADIYDMKLIQG